MQAPFDNIVQHLFHQPSLHSVTVDELESMTQQHPYFAAAHFLLLKKMQDTAHPQFTEQLHKTTIYFNNPLWLQYLLQPEIVADFSVAATSPFISPEPGDHRAEPAEENANGQASTETIWEKEQEALHAPAPETQYDPAGAFTTSQSAPGLDKEIVAAEQGGMMDVIMQVFSDPNPLYAPIAVDLIQGTAQEDVQVPAAALPEQPDNNNTEGYHPATPEQPAVEESHALFLEKIPGPADAATAQGNSHQVEGPAITEPPWLGESQTAAVADMHESPGESAPQPGGTGPEPADGLQKTTAAAMEAGDDTGFESRRQALTEQDIDAAAADNTDQPLSAADHTGEQPLFKTIIETPAAKNDLLFEPYHTVDYFASQGIKLSKMDAEAKDKLGRQLKSFTDWLKTMKKLPQVSIDRILAENEESKVVEDANHSIENKEVITEAMAEVFEKQGLHEKAVDIYRKLSLLNPAKSAYFAARIDHLKR